ncbi:hypothetical protein BDV96DRAFT_100675 [Lophiotrema nucula]|uniref:Adhesin domain-containing protein n=1 Tax=Lophiotrema nucula TaxID=690887 RepID=A0A6A5Z6W5_9PLEO|nr:hypothetical protein BDV96DRAFT_100675 [Lophiotrema nucula]
MFIDTEAANSRSKLPAIHIEETSKSPKPQYERESTPLVESFLGQERPPPSYLEATTPGPWNNEFSVRPSGDEGVRLLSFDGRTSPGPADEDGMYKGMAHRRKRLREHCTRRRLLKWIGALLLILLLAAIIAAATHKKRELTVSTIPLPAQPAQSSAPQKEYPIRWPSRCGKDYNVKTEDFNWGTPSELQIQEGVHQLDGPYKRVSGWVHFVKAPDSQAAGTIAAKLAYAVSPSVDVSSIKYSSSGSGLTIGDPARPDGFDGVQPGSACLGISVVVYLAAGAKIENLNVKSVHLGMQVHEGVSFSVTNSTRISLTTGTLDAPPFNSREVYLETISGSISGKYALMDVLSIVTKSGSVNVNIEPKEKAKDGSESAIFLAHTLSGSIRADFERKKIPERDYQVSIDTTVGSVDGTFIHGSKTNITSVAGFITADFVPYLSGSKESTMETKTSSGQTKLKIRSPYKKADGAVAKMTSLHKTVSGAIDLTYPQEWEGHLEGSTLNGSLHLQGKDLELIHQDQDVSGGSRIEAKKGQGNSQMVFGTVSGSIDVKVGKL